MYLLSYGMCANDLIESYPLGDLEKAVVFERDCGATTNFSVQVALLPGAQKFDNSVVGNVFVIDGLPTVKAVWHGGEHLEILIWFVSCEVAGDYSQVVSGAPNGKDFCKEVARAAGAYVKAGSAIQKAGKMSLAVGYIDEWEGDLFVFDPDGNPATRYVQPQ